MSYPQQPYGQYPRQPPPGHQPYGPPQPGYGPAPYGPPQQPFLLPYPIASTESRVVQGLIDALLQMIPVVIGMLAALAAVIGGYLAEQRLPVLAISAILYGLMFFLAWGFSFYNHVYRPARRGTDQTIGMAKRNLRVVKLDGRPMTMGDHAIRWLLFAFVESGLIALILIAATERKQRLGDLAAKTVVVQLPRQ